MKTYVIIGNSAAGISAVNKLRVLDEESNIICISKEKEHPYNKCKLAEYLAGDIQEEAVATYSCKDLQEKNIHMIFGERVSKIMSDNKYVLLESGEKISYDTLFIATGASAVKPNITGVKDKAGIFMFHTLADTKNILQFIEKNKPKHAVIIGAGMTGIECADSLCKLGLKVSVVERGQHVLSHFSDSVGAARVEHNMLERRVSLFTHEAAQEIIWENGTIGYVVLNSGTFIPADMVILAVGVKPNVQLAQDAGIKVGEFGIETDDHMQTNIDDIYAGGDVAQVKDFLTGRLLRSCNWPDACLQGMVVAHACVGKPIKYQGALSFAISHFFGLDFASFLHSFHHKAKYQEFVKEGDGFYHKVLLEDGFVRGFLLVGDIAPLPLLKKHLMSSQKLDLDLLYKT